MWDYGPGHGGRIYSPYHPEHAEPTEVLATLLLGQKFWIVGKHDGDGATNPAKTRNPVLVFRSLSTQRLVCQIKSTLNYEPRAELIYLWANVKHKYWIRVVAFTYWYSYTVTFLVCIEDFSPLVQNVLTAACGDNIFLILVNFLFFTKD